MKSYPIAFILALVAVFPAGMTAQPLDFSFPNYNTNNGLVTNVVHYGMQDSRGFMWFATDSGVSRFDGNRFRHFTTRDGLGGNEIFYIYEDSRERLWFLSFNGVPSYFHHNRFYHPGNDSVLAQIRFPNMLVSVFEDHDGDIWMFSQDATIYRISDGKPPEHHTNEGLFNTIRQAWVDADNNLMVGTSRNTFQFRKDMGRWEVVNDISYRVIQHQHTTYGSFVLPSVDGIVYTGSPETSPPYLIPRDVLDIQAEITFATRSRSRIYLAVGTMGDGLHFYEYEEGETRQRLSHLLEGHTVTSVAFDNQESIWVTTLRDGIYRIDRSYSNIRNIAAKSGLSRFSMRASYTSRDGYQWYGTDQGRLLSFSPDGVMHEPEWINPPEPKVSIEDIRELRDGRLALATVNSIHLVERRGDRLYTTHTVGNLSSKQLCQAEGWLAYGAINGLFVAPLHEPSNFRRIHEKRVTAMACGPHDSIWMGTISGLYQFNTSLEPIPLPAVFANQHIIRIEPLYEDRIAVATHGSGVWIYDPNEGRLQQIWSGNGLSDDLIKTLRFDGNQLWISTGTGITLVPLDPAMDLDFQINRLPEGLKYYSGRLFGTQIRRIELREDDIWLSGDNALLSLSRNEIGATPTVIPLHIDEIMVNDRLYSRDFPGRVRHTDNQWTFHFTGILFRDADRLQYFYRLVRDDESAEWSTSSTGTVTYRSIPPGSYTFEVYAVTPDGNASSRPVLFAFTIDRAWWMLPWVWFLIAAGVIGGIVLLFNYRIGQVQRQEAEKHRYQRQINELEYQALQAMMSPHFVFNILSSINYHILKDDKIRASRLLLDFSKLIRKQLDSAYQRSTSLAEELERLQLYVELESTRLPHPVHFVKEVGQDVDLITTHIPSMLLQPFVENAIIHGIIPKHSPGEIRVSVRRSESGQLLVQILDNGSGLKEDIRKTAEGNRLSLGITLVEQRLAILARDHKLDWKVTIENHTCEDGIVQGVSSTILLPVAYTTNATL